MELVRAIGKTVAEVARDLQINDTTLGKWVKADNAEGGVPDSNGLLPLTAAERADLTKLRRENAKLRVEREILKNAPAFSVTESSPGSPATVDCLFKSLAATPKIALIRGNEISSPCRRARTISSTWRIEASALSHVARSSVDSGGLAFVGAGVERVDVGEPSVWLVAPAQAAVSRANSRAETIDAGLAKVPPLIRGPAIQASLALSSAL